MRFPVLPRRGAKKSSSPSPFRKRFDSLEAKRAELLRRLETIETAGHRHPSTKRALTLLNQTFRKAKVAQRAAILQAADWLIQVIEMTLPLV